MRSILLALALVAPVAAQEVCRGRRQLLRFIALHATEEIYEPAPQVRPFWAMFSTTPTQKSVYESAPERPIQKYT